MTKTEVLDLLKKNRDARGETNWKAMGDRTGGLTSFGIGLTKLRAIAKQVGRDHDLALKLWNERNHDARIIGLLIDDPTQLTRDQIETQVDGAGRPNDQLVGGQGTLREAAPIRTIGSYWPYATTVFDYVRRAMPYVTPHSLTPDETYAVTAYLLALNGVIEQNDVIDASTLPKVVMPNRANFDSAYREPRRR